MIYLYQWIDCSMVASLLSQGLFASTLFLCRKLSNINLLKSFPFKSSVLLDLQHIYIYKNKLAIQLFNKTVISDCLFVCFCFQIACHRCGVFCLEHSLSQQLACHLSFKHVSEYLLSLLLTTFACN